MTTPVAAEIDRRDTAKSRVLAALMTGPKSSAELNRVCYRYSGRIMELRREGWPIASERGEGSLWTYTLTGPRAGDEPAPEHEPEMVGPAAQLTLFGED